MSSPPFSQRLLRYLCEFAAAYVLLLQAIGLVNLAAGKPLFNGPAVIVCTGCLLLGLVQRCRALPSAPLLPGKCLRLPWLILASVYVLFLADALTSYPGGYDPVSYHLAKPLSWLLEPSPLLADFKWQMALPANAELFTLPALALNLQNLAFWGNLLAVAILALSVCVICRQLSASEDAGAFSCLIVLSIPIVLFQSFYLDTDMFGTAFVMAALAFLLAFLRDNQTSAIVLSALCAGVSMGNKQVFLPYAGLVLLCAILAVWRRQRIGLIPLLMAAGAAPSSLWLYRNWVSTGNPFFPFPVRILGLSLRAATGYGFNPSPPTVLAAGMLAYHSRVAPISEFKGVGAVFSTFAIASLAAAIIESLRTRRTVLVAATALTAVVGAAWWVAVHIVRMGLPVLVMVAIFSALLYDRLLPVHRGVARTLLTIGMAVTCLLCGAAQLTTVVHRFRSGNWSRGAYYGYPELIDRLPPGTTILDRSHDGRMGFALAGRNLQNRVLHRVGPLSPADLSQPAFQYAVTNGPPDEDDPVLAQWGDLIFDGAPPTIFPKLSAVWRIYKLGRKP